ncbi:hypothetical protein HDU98_009365 [Podochytrium sp. JEL0797]|nr:hypothetical protein HDU98_009365 [Podochytrium sp. JEL0797]
MNTTYLPNDPEACKFLPPNVLRVMRMAGPRPRTMSTIVSALSLAMQLFREAPAGFTLEKCYLFEEIKNMCTFGLHGFHQGILDFANWVAASKTQPVFFRISAHYILSVATNPFEDPANPFRNMVGYSRRVVTLFAQLTEEELAQPFRNITCNWIEDPEIFMTLDTNVKDYLTKAPSGVIYRARRFVAFGDGKLDLQELEDAGCLVIPEALKRALGVQKVENDHGIYAQDFFRCVDNCHFDAVLGCKTDRVPLSSLIPFQKYHSRKDLLPVQVKARSEFNALVVGFSAAKFRILDTMALCQSCEWLPVLPADLEFLTSVLTNDKECKLFRAMAGFMLVEPLRKLGDFPQAKKCFWKALKLSNALTTLELDEQVLTYHGMGAETIFIQWHLEVFSMTVREFLHFEGPLAFFLTPERKPVSFLSPSNVAEPSPPCSHRVDLFNRVDKWSFGPKCALNDVQREGLQRYASKRANQEGACNYCNTARLDSDGNVTPLKECAKCREAWYCSTECQSTAWKVEHKAACRDPTDLRVGDIARVFGLVNNARLNGCVYEVFGFDEDKGKWKARWIGGTNEILVKRENLKRVLTKKVRALLESEPLIGFGKEWDETKYAELPEFVRNDVGYFSSCC